METHNIDLDTQVAENRFRIAAKLAGLIRCIGECWVFTGGRTGKGYGALCIFNRTLTAHRIAYMVWRGPIPNRYTIDHLCRNRACVNPRHLEPVTNRENVLRGIGVTAKYARKILCKNGHELVPLPFKSHTKRYCPICKRNYDRNWQRENKDKINYARRLRCGSRKSAGVYTNR